MTIQRFEDCIAWQKAQDLAVAVYSQFGPSRDFAFKDQILRAVVSVSNNIAEGFDRLTSNDMIRYLGIAIGSANETKSMVYLAKRLTYITDQVEEMMIAKCEEIIRIIWGLIRSLRLQQQQKAKPKD